MQTRAVIKAQRQARARHPVAGELGQRLGPERGAAGAEMHDVGGPTGEEFGGLAAGGEIIAAFAQA